MTRMAPPLEPGRVAPSRVPMESALIITCPAAEGIVGRWRATLDRAAFEGVPAHVTVLYPFLPVAELTDAGDGELRRICAALPPFEMTFSQVGWFGTEVVFLSLDDPDPVLDLVDRLGAAFPEWPPYGGAFDSVVPHLTVGESRFARDGITLEDAASAVHTGLPVRQPVTALELWSGPALAGRDPIPGCWTRARRYPLGSPL